MDERSVSLGVQLRKSREAAGLSQQELADQSGLDIQTIDDLERNTGKSPEPNQIRLLADCLRLSASERAELIAAIPRRTATSLSASEFSARLPGYLTALIGRERETAEALQLLSRPDVRLVSLTGPGGVGKTRLALALATAIADEFVDGVVFVPLAAIHAPELVIPTILQAVHSAGISATASSGDLVDVLHDRHLLLALDNFEQVRSSAPQLTDILSACPQLKILVTSRVVLRVRGEQEYPVPTLSVPPANQKSQLEDVRLSAAVRLFEQRAQAVRANFVANDANIETIAEICRRLDGLPLAIELAAARIKLLPPQALLARLEQRLALLTSGALDLPARQQTLRNTIAWSYNLLAAEEQQILRRFAVFSGGWTLEAAEEVCARTPGSSLLDGLATLIDHHLVQSVEQSDGTLRFMMLETIREFALEQLEAVGEQFEAQQLHAEFFLLLAVRAGRDVRGPSQAAWYDRLEQENDNLRSALQWFLESSAILDGLRLASSLWKFWDDRGYGSEGRHWLTLLLDRDLSERTSSERAYGLFALGRLCYSMGELAEARVPTEESIALARNLGDPLLLSHSLRQLAHIAARQREFDSAEAWYREGLAISREIEHADDIRVFLGSLGWLALLRGNTAEAEMLQTEALATAEVVGDRLTAAINLIFLGHCKAEQGDFAAAADHYRRSQTYSNELGGRPLGAKATAALGRAVAETGDYEHGRLLLFESLITSRDLGITQDVIDALEHLAGLAALARDWQRAIRLTGAIVELRRAYGTLFFLGWQSHQQRVIDSMRNEVTPEVFESAWQAGASYSLDQAITDALAVPSSPAQSTESVSQAQLAGSIHLTPRELDVLRLLAAGRSTDEIADALFITIQTARTHVTNILGKLGVSSRAAAVAAAFREGLV